MRLREVERPVTLVTGARKGIGRFLAEHYLSSGHLVVGCSRMDSDLHRDGYSHHCVDVTNEVRTKLLFSWIRRELGRLDNVLNNAGIASLNHSLLTPMSTVREILATNVLGTFLFCRESAKIMKKRRYGRIVNFTTVAVPLNLEGEAAYAASKAAVGSLTGILARELAEYGVTVNAVGPTAVATDLIASIPQAKIDRLMERQAIPRLATMQDVANVVDFYLQPGSDFITGQTIYLGGV
jgi:3-oxoacyl-[acyl-carrier protein] reductase